MGIWLVPRSELTTDQLAAVELPPREHRVVFGPPGSGKTLLLLHRARYLCDRLKTPPDRFRILVFTNVLKEYIRSALHLLDLPEANVLTFDYWCVGFYLQHIERRLPDGKRGPDFAAIRRSVRNRLNQDKGLGTPFYDFVLVDEGQDLTEDAYEILRQIARHVTVCLDPKQQVYEEGVGEAQVLRCLGLPMRSASLLQAFRCCPHVVHVASRLLADPREREYYLRQVATEQSERERPLLYAAAGLDDEIARLVEVIRARTDLGQSVGIFLPNNAKLRAMARRLRGAGQDVEVIDSQSARRGDHGDFSNEAPKLLSYFGAKGLTFDAVFLPRLVPSAFVRFSDAAIRRLLFVGITRATRWVYLGARADAWLPQLDALSGAEGDGDLVVQRGGEATSTGTGGHEPRTPLDLDDLL